MPWWMIFFGRRLPADKQAELSSEYESNGFQHEFVFPPDDGVPSDESSSVTTQ